MIANASAERIAIAKRIAAQNGVSVGEVLAKFERGVKKATLTRADFFWGCSDISLGRGKSFGKLVDMTLAALAPCKFRAIGGAI